VNDFIQPLGIQPLGAWLVAHTYALVFVATLVDATAIPFPGRVVLAAAGAVAAAGDVDVLLVIALGAAGASIVDHAWYFAGSLGGDRLLRLYCRLTFSSPDCMERASGWFERYGPLIILVGRFVAAVRVLTWPLARDHGVRYPTFVALEVPAALLWTGTWVGLGWLLGARWAEAPTQARWVMVGLACAGALAFLAVSLWRRARARRGSGARASRGSPALPPARPRP
jgi:membrane protein DedA with SNARE-associated domain